MTRRMPNPDQLPLFAEAATSAATEEANPMSQIEPALEMPEPVGPVVWLADRSAGLLHVLHDIGQARRRSGFDLATQQQSPHAPGIQQRYGADLSAVRSGAAANETRLWMQAENELYRTMGMAALREAGVTSIEGVDLDTHTRSELNGLERQYFGPGNEAERRRFRKILEWQLTVPKPPAANQAA